MATAKKAAASPAKKAAASPDAPKPSTTKAEAVEPFDENERVARVRAGYGQDCAACGQRMLGGQGLQLDEKHRPIHRLCA